MQIAPRTVGREIGGERCVHRRRVVVGNLVQAAVVGERQDDRHGARVVVGRLLQNAE